MAKTIETKRTTDPRELKPLLQKALSGQISEPELGLLVSIFYALALTFVKAKRARGWLQLGAMTASDIALDSIADLFTRNEKGELIQLTSYYQEYSQLKDTSENEVLSMTRRLVFSSVNAGFFRLYRENDPALAKVLRNIKLAVANSDRWETLERFGEQEIWLKSDSSSAYLPPTDSDFLKHLLSDLELQRRSIPSILESLADALSEQEERQRGFRLVDLSLALRKAYSQFSKEPEEHTILDYVALDLEEILTKSTTEVLAAVTSKYKGTKFTQEELGVIIKTIEAKIKHIFGLASGPEETFLETLVKNGLYVDRKEYNQKYRTTVEYLYRITSDRIKQKLLKEYL